MRHWFDGFAMLHRFGFADGKVSYANRFLESAPTAPRRRRARSSTRSSPPTPAGRSSQRVSSVFSPKLSDNANVNLVKLGERFIAMTETPIPVEFDPETLATAGVAYEAPGILTTAHPHLDRATGGMLNYAAKLGPRNQYRFFRLGPSASKPEVIGELPVREPAYMHSFGLTERWMVLAEFPFVVNPLATRRSAAAPTSRTTAGSPSSAPASRCSTARPARPRGPFETDPCFGFHHVNAYEQDGEVVVDVCAFDDAAIVEDLYLEHLRAGSADRGRRAASLPNPPEAGTVDSERLIDDGWLELPRINYGRCNERPYRYAWGVRDAAAQAGSTRSSAPTSRVARRRPGRRTAAYPGEPVFVAAPGAAEEDEGVLLSVVLDADRGTSFLLVLDAATLDELARAEAPHHIPFGFHGQFAA